MRKSFQSICEEPVGADEQMLAGWEEALEECGMGMHREHGESVSLPIARLVVSEPVIVRSVGRRHLR